MAVALLLLLGLSGAEGWLDAALLSSRTLSPACARRAALRMGAVPKSAFANRARYLRWRLCMQERGLRSLALGKADAARPGFVYVLACSGLKAFHVSKAARRCATDLTKVMMQYYPDCAPPPPPPPTPAPTLPPGPPPADTACTPTQT